MKTLAVAALILLSGAGGTTETAPDDDIGTHAGTYACSGSLWMEEARCLFRHSNATFSQAYLDFSFSCTEEVETICYTGAYGAELTNGPWTFRAYCGIPSPLYPCGFGDSYDPTVQRLEHIESSCWFQGTGNYSCRWSIE